MDVVGQIRHMREKAMLAAGQAEALEIKELERFLASPLAEEIRRGRNVRREYPFTLLVDAEAYNRQPVGEGSALLQGVVDCCFETEDGLTVVDFKTDAVRGKEEVRERAERYRPQLEAYSWALEQVLERPVTRRVLYFLRCGEAVEL